MTRTILLLSACVAVLGCKDDDTPPTASHGTEHPSSAANAPNLVDLTFTGALTGALKGRGGMCAPGQGATFRVHSNELGVKPPFQLTILVTGEEDWDNPVIQLEVEDPKASYARDRIARPAGETIQLARDLSGATIDTTLTPMRGEEPIKVKGTFRCPKPAAL